MQSEYIRYTTEIFDKIDIKYDGERFSAMGEIRNYGCGQVLEEILRRNKSDKTVRRIVKVWRKYHLNDMNAGTPAQTKELKRRQKLEKLDRMPNYDIQCQWLKDAGLYEVPLTSKMKCTGGFPTEVESKQRGYRYGERWLLREIPASVKKEIESILQSI